MGASTHFIKKIAETLCMSSKGIDVELYGAKSKYKFFFYGQNAACNHNMEIGNISVEVLEQSNTSEQH